MTSSLKRRTPTRTRDLLRRTQIELAEGKQLLNQKKKQAKSAKGKLARDNAKRIAKLLDRTVRSIEDHQDILAHKLVAETVENKG